MERHLHFNKIPVKLFIHCYKQCISYRYLEINTPRGSKCSIHIILRSKYTRYTHICLASFMHRLLSSIDIPHTMKPDFFTVNVFRCKSLEANYNLSQINLPRSVQLSYWQGSRTVICLLWTLVSRGQALHIN